MRNNELIIIGKLKKLISTCQLSQVISVTNSINLVSFIVSEGLWKLWNIILKTSLIVFSYFTIEKQKPLYQSSSNILGVRQCPTNDSVRGL